jgi:hypothetical protein
MTSTEVTKRPEAYLAAIIYTSPMLRFFRKSRSETLQKKESNQYLGYAVGELVLVVLGILIALQINNWNENRIEQRQITEYAHALIKDLERDLAMAEVIEAEINLLIKKIDTLAAYLKDRPVDQLDNLDLFYLMYKPFYRPYSWNRTALDQIKSSGALRQMDNQQLAEEISEYEALTRHLDGDFNFDRTLGTNALALASGVIDMNYEGIRNIFPIGKVVEPFSFPNPKLHEAYSSKDLSLLTNDIKDFKVVLNAYLILANTPGIRPRAEIEMPQLVSKARELIDVLNKEYPE